MECIHQNIQNRSNKIKTLEYWNSAILSWSDLSFYRIARPCDCYRLVYRGFIKRERTNWIASIRNWFEIWICIPKISHLIKMKAITKNKMRWRVSMVFSPSRGSFSKLYTYVDFDTSEAWAPQHSSVTSCNSIDTSLLLLFVIFLTNLNFFGEATAQCLYRFDMRKQ